MNDKKLITIVCSLGLMLIIVLGVIIVMTKANNIKKIDKQLIGKYELKELVSSKGTYTQESLKNELNRSITIEVTKTNFIKTTTYYGVEQRESTSTENYTYDMEKLYDPETSKIAFYSYKFENGKLILKNLETDETIIFTKIKD